MRWECSPRSTSAGSRRLPTRGRRRLAGAAALALALVFAFAEGAAAKMMGIIYPETCSFYDAATAAFKAHLAANGFGPDKLEIFVQKPAADQMSWTNAVRKFAAVDADLIVVWGDSLLQTLCREKIKTRVGFGYVLEPGLNSCVRSASNAGGTATGVGAHTPLRTLVATARLMTDFTTVGIMTFPDDPVSRAHIEELKPYEKELGYTVSVINVAQRAEAVAAFRNAPAPGLFLLPNCSLVSGQIEELLAVAAAKKIPTISLMPPRGAVAALLSLYPSPEEQGQLLGEQAVQILGGGSPANPLLLPKKIELEVNLPLARQLGVKTPMSLLSTATKVIK
ncbi:MAG: ABC transporter substrate-binding protein [Candidatus Methylomirabilia bacterium]